MSDDWRRDYVLTADDIVSIFDLVTTGDPRAMQVPNGTVAALIAMLRNAEGVEQRLADRFVQIRLVMLIGLEDAELHAEAGRERIRQLADWIEAEVLVAVRGEDPDGKEGGGDV